MSESSGSTALAPPFVELTGTSVVREERLTEESLLALVAGDILALVVRDYCPTDKCAQIVSGLLADNHYSEYENVPGVHKWGLNTYEGLSSPEREKKYFADAMPIVQALRASWAPHLSPIDRLRLELQETWPAGANLEHLEGRGLFVGQARVFEEHNGAMPHQDFLPWELSDLRRTPGGLAMHSQLTANVYLQTPDQGGELELWAAGYDHEEYDRLRAAPGSYGVDRSRIPAPVARITPEPGTLILFHATRLHAVLASEGRARAALSCFIGVRSLDRPLSYWS